MRKAIVHGAVAVAVAMTLAVSAEAKPRAGQRWFERKVDPIVKFIKKLVMKSTGDGLSDPWPRP